MKIPILKNCLVICERFKSRILCFELNAVEKYNVLERVFEAVRDESSLRKQPSFFATGLSPLGLGAKKDGCSRRLRRKLLSPRRRLVQKKRKQKRRKDAGTKIGNFVYIATDMHTSWKKVKRISACNQRTRPSHNINMAKSRRITRYSKGTCNSKLSCCEFVALVIV